MHVPVSDVCVHPHRRARDGSPYGGGVLRPMRPVALRWAFLIALALGIVGMHHIAMPGMEQQPRHTMSAAMSPGVSVQTIVEADSACCDGMGGHGGTHDMLHLCLAVLCAAAALLLAWLFLRRKAMTFPPRSRRSLSAHAGRSPPIVHRPTSLSSLCVLRL